LSLRCGVCFHCFVFVWWRGRAGFVVLRLTPRDCGNEATQVFKIWSVFRVLVHQRVTAIERASDRSYDS